jgi:VWFA-related protein
MPRFAIAFVIGAISTVFLHAQGPPTFRVGTTLIEFTLVALDSRGNPVTDLTKEDLVLSEGTRTRDIAFFRFDGDMPAVSTPTQALPAGFVTNRPEPERNAVALVLDQLNVGAHGEYGQTAIRGLLQHYLNSLPPNTYVGLFRFAETKPMDTLQTFTQRVDLVRAKVNTLDLALRLELSSPTSAPSGGASKADGGAALAAMAAAEARGIVGINAGIVELRFARTLEGLQALGSHLAGIPGRKSLIWITDAPPIQFPVRDVDRVSYAGRIQQAAQQLANQGIAVYPVSPGLRVPPAVDTSDRSTFGIFAGVTGGRSIVDTNDLTEGVKLAARDQRGTYAVGFYADDEPDDEWHPIRVAVKRSGVSLNHRQGYLAVRRAQAQSWPEKNWNDLVYQPLDSTGIRLNGRSDASGNEATLSLQIAAADLYFHERAGKMIADLEIGLIEKTQKGPTNVRVQPMEVSLEATAVGQRPALVPVKTTWPLNAGTSGVRAVVRDRFTGRYGTLDLPRTSR